MEKFKPKQEHQSSNESLMLEIGGLQKNIESLKNVIQIASSAGLNALKIIFKK